MPDNLSVSGESDVELMAIILETLEHRRDGVRFKPGMFIMY